MSFEEALHVGGGLELPAGIAFERFDHDRGDRLGPHQEFAAVTGDPAIAIPGRGVEDGVTVLQARAHPDIGLLLVVDPLIVGDHHAHIFDEARGRVVAVDHRRRFQRPAHLIDHAAQIAMEVDVTAETVDVIEDDAVAARGVGLHDREEGIEARTALRTSGQVICEGADNLITLGLGVVETGGQLRVQPVARNDLLLAGDAAIDQRKLGVMILWLLNCSLAHPSLLLSMNNPCCRSVILHRPNRSRSDQAALR
nr:MULTISPECIES: hypothetical protein [unclassified Methylobacterium]